ncbi:AAA family ATPase [Fibrella sp. WM1]|uniref:AAA family ATPase n=1 Tax=Fibrella musci TaxID=3242485 RepID=UPI00352262DA
MAIELNKPFEDQTGVRFIQMPGSRWFDEFATACGQYRYIGLCYGAAGVGKTWSARYFSQWETAQRVLKQAYYDSPVLTPPNREPLVKAIYYTAPVTNTPRRLQEDLALDFNTYRQVGRLSEELNRTLLPTVPAILLVDEADRLNVNSLEFLRDLYDHHGFELVLIGMPGLEKRLKRYPQLYSRVGFAHHFRELANQDLTMLLTGRDQANQPLLVHPPFADELTLGAVVRTCRGNMRLLTRLLSQIDRIVAINQLKHVTLEVVQKASLLLTIGPPD